MKIALYYAALFYLTWFFYLAVMSLKMARDAGRLTKTAEVLGMPLLFVGLALDFTLNMASTLIFMDLPHEYLLTIRCDRYLRTDTGWRYLLARALCRNLLDPFQIGGHCH